MQIRRSLIKLPALVVMVVIAVGVMLAGVATAQQRAASVGVDAVRVEPMAQTMAVIGRFVASESGAVAARIAERVAEIPVRVGDRVQRGDVLVRLADDRLVDERLLMAAEARAAEAAARREAANLAKARQTLERQIRLRGSNAFRQDRVEDAERDVEAAEAELAGAEAAVARARSRLALADTALSDASITAPYPGVVLARNAVVGSYVRIGDPTVMLLNDSDLEIEADVPADRVGGLVPGVIVEASLQDGSTFFTAVRAVVPEENPRTRTRGVRFTPQLDTVAGRIADNQGVTIRIPIGATRDVLTVHKDAVTVERGQATVYKVVDGKAEIAPVRTGDAVGNRFEVLEGLAAGDVVVIRGNERLRPGQPVSPLGAS